MDRYIKIQKKVLNDPDIHKIDLNNKQELMKLIEKPSDGQVESSDFEYDSSYNSEEERDFVIASNASSLQNCINYQKKD